MAINREKCAGLLKEIFYQNVKDFKTNRDQQNINNLF